MSSIRNPVSISLTRIFFPLRRVYSFSCHYFSREHISLKIQMKYVISSLFFSLHIRLGTFYNRPFVLIQVFLLCFKHLEIPSFWNVYFYSKIFCCYFLKALIWISFSPTPFFPSSLSLEFLLSLTLTTGLLVKPHHLENYVCQQFALQALR